MPGGLLKQGQFCSFCLGKKTQASTWVERIPVAGIFLSCSHSANVCWEPTMCMHMEHALNNALHDRTPNWSMRSIPTQPPDLNAQDSSPSTLQTGPLAPPTAQAQKLPTASPEASARVHVSGERHFVPEVSWEGGTSRFISQWRFRFWGTDWTNKNA